MALAGILIFEITTAVYLAKIGYTHYVNLSLLSKKILRSAKPCTIATPPAIGLEPQTSFHTISAMAQVEIIMSRILRVAIRSLLGGEIKLTTSSNPLCETMANSLM
jgi:hypothetical protein